MFTYKYSNNNNNNNRISIAPYGRDFRGADIKKQTVPKIIQTDSMENTKLMQNTMNV